MPFEMTTTAGIKRICGAEYQNWAHDHWLEYGETVVCFKEPHPSSEIHWNYGREFGWMSIVST